MSLQTEFLWRLATEVQELEDRALVNPPGRQERFFATQLRELYAHAEQLPASHALFRGARNARENPAGPMTSARLRLVTSADAPTKSRARDCRQR